MGVRVQRDGDAGVPQALAHDLRVDAAGEKQAGVRVPEIMEPLWVDTRLLHHTPEGTPEVAAETKAESGTSPLVSALRTCSSGVQPTATIAS
jgi:hypothetical protein